METLGTEEALQIEDCELLAWTPESEYSDTLIVFAVEQAHRAEVQSRFTNG
jgi:hypothetical protein